ncbi:hypothetical protein NNJEOMEG_02386 [Fundidesulfovibrio magnetotacticus]|uniref:Uncharacterized protein n=1 Tax=Fundidesulfovibrio magnetotacticus TaxID=2730080 RepID=A0A6V8LUA8_9BACT|nr:hypothetical protein [Fundidesulfovibrio magnetotacticus]GFK94540.1 hypothetical protein NNJEOMEG_02386 [Fundidesulfovibrio magnetotacticus]
MTSRITIFLATLACIFVFHQECRAYDIYSRELSSRVSFDAEGQLRIESSGTRRIPVIGSPEPDPEFLRQSLTVKSAGRVYVENRIVGAVTSLKLDADDFFGDEQLEVTLCESEFPSVCAKQTVRTPKRSASMQFTLRADFVNRPYEVSYGIALSSMPVENGKPSARREYGKPFQTRITLYPMNDRSLAVTYTVDKAEGVLDLRDSNRFDDFQRKMRDNIDAYGNCYIVADASVTAESRTMTFEGFRHQFSGMSRRQLEADVDAKAQEAARKIVSLVGGGRDIHANVLSFTKGPRADSYEIKVDVSFNGAIFAFNHYRFGAVIRIDAGEMRFTETWASQNYTDLKERLRIIIPPLLLLASVE